MRTLVVRFQNGINGYEDAVGKVSIMNLILCKFSKYERMLRVKPIWYELVTKQPLHFYKTESKNFTEIDILTQNVITFMFLNQKELDKLFFLKQKEQFRRWFSAENRLIK